MSLNIDILAAHPDIIRRLGSAKIVKLEDVILKTSADLQKQAQLTDTQTKSIREQAYTLLYRVNAISALDRLGSACAKIPTGCDSIDKLLNGGVLCQGITELSGESSCGKTQICLQLALHSQLVKRNGRLCNCLYICTEDAFPSQRLLQLEQSMIRKYPSISKHKFTDHVFVEHMANKDELLATLENRVPKLLARGLTNLLIVDSVTAVFRGQEEQQTVLKRSRDLSAIGIQLHRLAEQYKVAVVCVNQVTADMRENKLEKNHPALGLTWSNLVTTRLQVRRSYMESSARQFAITFAPHLPPDYCEYEISQEGVVPTSNWTK